MPPKKNDRGGAMRRRNHRNRNPKEENKTTMKPTELPACPVCGGKAKRVYDPDDSMHLLGYVECTKCGLRTKHGTRIGEAVKTWKKRVAAASAQAVADAAMTLDKQLPAKADVAPATAKSFFKTFVLARIGLMMLAEQMDEAFSIAVRMLGQKTMRDALKDLCGKEYPQSAKAPQAPAKPAEAAPSTVATPAKAKTRVKAPAKSKKSAKKGVRK